MFKAAVTTAVVAFALLLTGCGASQPSTELTGVAKFAASAEEVSEPTSEPTEAADITAAGEVCDIDSVYTIECSVKFPEVGFLNAVNRVATEPLLSMNDEEKIALAESACSQLASGVAAADVDVVDSPATDEKPAGWNNAIVASAAPLGYCHEYADQELIAPFVGE